MPLSLSQIEQVRAFGLAVLHFALCLMLALLIYAVFIYWPNLEQPALLMPLATVGVAGLAILANFRTARRHFMVVRHKQARQPVDLIAFGLAAVGLTLASQIFAL